MSVPFFLFSVQRYEIYFEQPNILSEKYDQEVLSSVRQFSDIINDYIEVNQKNLSAANDMADATSRIAAS